MTRLARSVAVAVTMLTIVTAGAGKAVTAPLPFHLVFDGKHNENLWHEGPFTSSAAWCTSGSAVDVDVDDTTLTAVRRFTCDGGGEFTARIGSLRAEHGGTGNWTIIGGSGPLADLRGTGTFTSVRLNGNQDDPASITFRSTWDGFAAFDVLPPTISIASASIRKLARPGNWRVVALADVDDAEGATSWQLIVSDRRKPLFPLGSKNGESANGTIRIVIQLRVPKGTRTLRLQIDGTDAVGNHASSVKPLRLP